jgi:hypothetical protein
MTAHPARRAVAEAPKDALAPSPNRPAHPLLRQWRAFFSPHLPDG